VETGRQHRPDRYPAAHSYKRAFVAQCDSQPPDPASYLHSRASDRTPGRHANSICSPKPDTNLHRHAVPDLDANNYPYHNVDADLDADFYVNSHPVPHSNIYGHGTLADANSGFTDAYRSNGHQYASAAYIHFNRQSGVDFNAHRNAVPYHYVDVSALKGCPWI